MTAPSSFSAKSWLKANCRGGERLKSETVDQVADFTLMWNLFEDQACSNNANVRCFKRLARTIARKAPKAFAQLPTEMADGLEFWKQRYLTPEGFNDSFHSLCFRNGDRQKDVEAVLQGDKTDAESGLLAVMIIIYRFRNNLFHGLKQIGALNTQTENLQHSCCILAKLLELSNAYVIKRYN